MNEWYDVCAVLRIIVTRFDIGAQRRQLAVIVGVRRQTNEDIDIHRSDRATEV
jgi:DNA-binding XRE family transcriptional regulator